MLEGLARGPVGNPVLLVLEQLLESLEDHDVVRKRLFVAHALRLGERIDFPVHLHRIFGMRLGINDPFGDAAQDTYQQVGIGFEGV